MELYGRNSGRNGLEADPAAEWAEAVPVNGIEESMRSLGIMGREFYPERGGVLDCAYYMRTGSCGYGNKCRYNHPRERSSVGGSVRTVGGEYPERIGEPECQYYLRTGTCKFTSTCKFHHPRNGGGSLSDVSVNIYGYPLRPSENECSYYLKTGHCKFGTTCKFHHPHPAGISVPASARPFYPNVQSSAPSPEQYGGPTTSYRPARPPLLPGSYVSGAYGPLLLPQGMVPIPNWTPYSGSVSPAMSPGTQHSVGLASLYGMSQLSSSAPAFSGPYTPVHAAAVLSSNSQTERLFPERPGEPECQYYMKTGNCKFGSSCKYNHPPDWVVTKTASVLSHIGLPLRPGVQPCSFYLQNGYCKFGQICKFDHPVGASRYTPSASSLSEMAVTPYMLQSSPATLAPAPFSELHPELVSRSNLAPHLARDPSSGNTPSNTATSMFSQTAHASLSDVQLSRQSSPPLTMRNTGQGGEARPG